MADNVQFQDDAPATPADGTIVATKEVSFSGDTTKVQLLEVVAVTGSEGSRTLNEISDASGLKIQDGGNTITVDGTVSVTGVATAANQSTANTALAAIQTAVETLDNAVAGNEIQVDIVTMPTVTVNSHAVTNAGTFAVQVDGAALTSLQLIDDAVYTDGSGTPSKALGVAGTDGTNPQIIKTDSNGELQVDVLTMPTVAVTQSGTWDEVGINDSGNSITVDDGGTSLTVDGTVGVSGTVTVDGSGSTQPVSHAALTELAAAIDTEVQVDVVGALPAGTNNIGDVDVLSLPAIPAGNNNIGDVDIASIAAGDNNIGNVDVVTLPSLPAGTNAIGKLAANSGVDIGDVDVTSLPAIPAGTNAIGKLLPPDIDVTAHTNYAKKYYTNAGAVTDGIVWSPAAGKRWHVVSMFINTSAAATVTFEDDKSGGDEAVMKMELAANSGMTINYGEKYPLASGEDAADLLVTTSAGNIYITVTGYEV